MSVAITALYAAFLGIIFIAFSGYVSSVRSKTGVGTGDGGNIQMVVAMRRHGNMAEYVPFALILMALAEISGLSATWLHVAGVLLVAGRLVHPFGIAEDGGVFAARIGGQLATYSAMTIPIVYVLMAGIA